MSGFLENAAYGASEKPGRRERAMNLGTAQRMLPLVRRIVADLLGIQQQLTEREPEQERLDRQRRTLGWPDRARRYQLHEEIAGLIRRLQEVMAELDGLGVALVDPAEGRVGFPTIVNDRPAFFSWVPGEDGLKSWHFVDEVVRRTIPPAWLKAADIRLARRS